MIDLTVIIHLTAITVIGIVVITILNFQNKISSTKLSKVKKKPRGADTNEPSTSQKANNPSKKVKERVKSKRRGAIVHGGKIRKGGIIDFTPVKKNVRESLEFQRWLQTNILDIEDRLEFYTKPDRNLSDKDLQDMKNDVKLLKNILNKFTPKLSSNLIDRFNKLIVSVSDVMLKSGKTLDWIES